MRQKYLTVILVKNINIFVLTKPTHMKKILFTPLAVFATANLFAAFTETANTFDSVSGFDIVGTGSVSELASSSYSWIRFSGTLNFDGDAGLTLTASNTKLGTSANYSFVALNSSGATLNFTGQGILRTAQSNTAGINTYNGPITINVANGAGGIITPKVCAQNQELTLNLHQENAIRRNDGSGFSLCVVKTTNFNMTANQHIGADFRSGTITNFNITNGSYLFIDRVDNILTNGITTNFQIADNKLEDGAILFNKDIVSSGYNSETGDIIIQVSSRLQTIHIKDSTGKALTGLDWDEVSIDGNDYFKLTGMAVPEPAEWAAIFGAAALALAVYRRRK